eukprot:480407_1
MTYCMGPLYSCVVFSVPVLLATESYVLSPGYCPIDTVSLTDEFTFEFDLEMFTWSGSFIHIFDIVGGGFTLRYSGSIDMLYLLTTWPEQTKAVNRLFKSPDDDNINVHHEIILTQNTVQWKMDGILIVNGNKSEHMTGTFGPVCVPSAGNGYADSSGNKGKISNFQIIPTTKTPTSEPTQSPTTRLDSIEYMYGNVSCNNLHANVGIDYDNQISECRAWCDNRDDCAIFNYFEDFKQINDSRCYIFDTLCDISIDNERKSVIGYFELDKTCVNYPSDWTDNTGDDCDYYKTYNWCSNTTLFSN